MTDELGKSLIDYFVSKQSSPWYSNLAIWISFFALIVSFRSVYIASESIKETDRRHIRSEWNGILDTCIKYPQFMDVSFVRDYLKHEREIGLIYEAFCYKVWSLFDFIATKKFRREPQYVMITQWIAAYHWRWLRLNRSYFTSKEFSNIYESARAEPVQFRVRTLPLVSSKPTRNDGDRYSDAVDWDRVHENYADWVLSPLAREMVELNDRGLRRNVLITRLLEIADLKGKKILDLGCGPGNLLGALHEQGRLQSKEVGVICGLDISERALALASEKAQKLGISFIPINGDIRSFVSKEKFDIIISINSILPTKREDVVPMLQQISRNLSESGQLLAILPSFDTCLELENYWEEACKKRSKDMALDEKKAFRDECAHSFKESKKLDEHSLSFADDGVHVQCFHNLESIANEFPKAGLRVIGAPQKIQYPWEYAEKFDYGYFPEKPEIWDWFVEAEKIKTA